MQRHLVIKPEHALLYLADCALATVSDMAMKKSRKKNEFERHIRIAQTAVDWIKDFKIMVTPGSRVDECCHYLIERLKPGLVNT